MKMLETSSVETKMKLMSIDENLKSLNPITEDNVKNIDVNKSIHKEIAYSC